MLLVLQWPRPPRLSGVGHTSAVTLATSGSDRYSCVGHRSCAASTVVGLGSYGQCLHRAQSENHSRKNRWHEECMTQGAPRQCLNGAHWELSEKSQEDVSRSHPLGAALGNLSHTGQRLYSPPRTQRGPAPTSEDLYCGFASAQCRVVHTTAACWQLSPSSLD